MASPTAEDPHVLFQLPALRAAAGVAVLCQELGNDTFERSAPLVARGPAPPRERDVLVAGAPQQGLPDPFVEFFPGRFQHGAGRKARTSARAFPPHRGRYAVSIGPSPAICPATRCNLAETSDWARESTAGDQTNKSAPARCTGAHALGTVEAEQLRAGRFKTLLAMSAGVVGGEGKIGGGSGGERDIFVSPRPTRVPALSP